eukprot:Clim_evm1s81 gene=Clim_evmTU1s81
MAPISTAVAAATGYLYLINTADMVPGNMDTDSVPGFFEEESYVWPSLYQTPHIPVTKANIVATDSTETPCNFGNKTLSIDLEMNEGSLDIYTQAYQNADGTCALTILDAVPVARPSGNEFGPGGPITIWASNLKSRSGALNEARLVSCDEHVYLKHRGCPGLSMAEQDQGLNIPYTGHLVATNVDATISGNWGVSDSVSNLFVKSSGVWPNEASFGYPSTDLGIIAKRRDCDGQGSAEIQFSMNQGTATVEFEFKWRLGGCVPHFKKAAYEAGNGGSPFEDVDGNYSILAVTKPMKNDSGVPVVNIAACTQDEWNNDSCQNAPHNMVLGGINTDKST